MSEEKTNDSDEIQAGKQQYYAVKVPHRSSFLRMGDRPSADTADHETATSFLEKFAGVAATDEREQMAKGFIHGDGPAATGDPEDFFDKAGWVDGTAGNRVSLTGGDKVEVVDGNFKIIACDGDCGIDMSGGHMRMWSKTPGYMSQVVSGDAKIATETLAAKDYRFQQYGGSYAETWYGEKFEASFGEVPTPTGGLPAPGTRDPAGVAMQEYKERITSEVILEEFNSSSQHIEMVRAVSFVESRAVKSHLLLEVESPEARVEEKIQAKTYLEEDTASEWIERAGTVGGSSAKEKLTPGKYEETIASGMGSAVAVVQSSGVETTTSCGPSKVVERVAPSGVTTTVDAPVVSSTTTCLSRMETTNTTGSDVSAIYGGTVKEDIFATAMYHGMIAAPIITETRMGAVLEAVVGHKVEIMPKGTTTIAALDVKIPNLMVIL